MLHSQAKINRFAAESCVYEYNQTTRNGTRAVPDLLKRDASPNVVKRFWCCLCRSARPSSQVRALQQCRCLPFDLLPAPNSLLTHV